MADRKKEIYTHQASWIVYALSWSSRVDQRFRLAIGSFIENYTNKIDIIQLNEEKQEFVVRASVDHPYPATKIAWRPEKAGAGPDLFATTGDYLRLWQVNPDRPEVELKHLLNNNKSSEFCAPLTSFDWNEHDPRTIGTCSIDTTCTIWDVETQTPKTQLIAHDKEVYDIAFRSADHFASVGADGSVRMFDLNDLKHSTIVFESPELTPLLRLAWNKQDPNYLATITNDSNKTIILDIRMPSLPAAELQGHLAPVNAVAWAPHSSCHVCTAADDKQALIWDLQPMPKPIDDPILAYQAEAEVNNLHWSSTQNEWIAIAFSNKVQILRV
eukprot:TRINITY_DN30911_c0_g1_i1.p1 TRINITY_DN30911_c0_g1~~TRINITY_DN30911_c0_g1_i1.p1  ORF type:complete len:328 (-),score=98.65 TRINITY_DN30911_c0_g1_i1:34-1017(-)